MQIQDKIKKAYKKNLIQKNASNQIKKKKEKEIMNNLEQRKKTITKNPVFSFAILQSLTVINKNAAINKLLITLTNISKNTNFLKRSMENLVYSSTTH